MTKLDRLIGLTGGMGSGKSFVAKIFETLQVPVYESDARAKMLMEEDPELRQSIVSLFGLEIIDTDKKLDRKKIAEIVFQDPDRLNDLNALIHPAVYKDLIKWINEPSQQAAPYLVQESAILFEAKLADRFQAIILVVAPEALRIERIMERDETTESKIRDRMRHQWDDAQKIPLSDYVIYNDGQRPLIRQVMDIDKMIRSGTGST